MSADQHALTWHPKKLARSSLTLEQAAQRRRAQSVAAAVLDPEVPVLTIAELGILRGVEINDDGSVTALLTPTYSGCPAVSIIEQTVQTALQDAGFSATTERVLSPAWTTDWITEQGREKLRAYGISPPAKVSSRKPGLFEEPVVACPLCGSSHTSKVSEFGSTACKAHYRCENCKEPFDYFKCL